jgi:hypothetical protein
MRALDLDYQRTRWRSSAALGWAVLAIGMLTASMVVHAALRTQEDLADLEAHAARLERKPARTVRGNVSAQESKRLSDEIGFADAVAARLTFPWQDLLQAIEVASTNGVALLSLQPDVSKKLVRITAESKTTGDMLGYVRAFSSNKRLADVHVISHEVETAVPGKPVRFTVQASWVGKTP